MLRLYCIEDFERCPRDKWGIPDAGRSRLDLQEEASDNRRQDGAHRDYLHSLALS